MNNCKWKKRRKHKIVDNWFKYSSTVNRNEHAMFSNQISNSFRIKLKTLKVMNANLDMDRNQRIHIPSKEVYEHQNYELKSKNILLLIIPSDKLVNYSISKVLI